MKHEFETGTSYPQISGVRNGGYIINRDFAIDEAVVYNEIDYAECGLFSEAPAMIREEVLDNISGELANDIKCGHFYRYEGEGEGVCTCTYIFDWD